MPPKLSRGLLSHLKPKVIHSEDNVVSESTVSKFINVENHSTDTQTDRLIQEQYNTTKHGHGSTPDTNTKDDKDKKKTAKRKKMGLSFDWEITDDTTNDKFSLRSFSDSNLQLDINGSAIKTNFKKAKIIIGQSATTTTASDSPTATDIKPLLPPITTQLPEKTVILAMDEDDENIASPTVVKPISTVADPQFNIITNSLGIGRTEKMQFLQQKQIEHRSSSHHSALTTTAPTQHWTDKTLEEMTPRDWHILCEDCHIVTKGHNVPRPLRFWDELDVYNVPQALTDAIKAVGYRNPTAVQRIAMPTSLLDRDIIARSQTGSGKTCSFLIPVLTYISQQPQLNNKTCLDGPYALILAPARELATQIHQEAIKLMQFMPYIKSACIIGGVKNPRLEDKIELIIATPGRLVDILQQHELVLKQCRYIILDEADRMLDEGFEPQLQQILESMPSSQSDKNQSTSTLHSSGSISSAVSSIMNSTRRRTILYSATFNSRIEELAQKYMAPDFIKIEVGDKESKINPSITQVIEWCYNDGNKMEKLCHFLNTGGNLHNPNKKCIIFCARKEQCDSLCSKIRDLASGGGNLHGSKRALHLESYLRPIVLHSDALDREANLQAFKDGRFNVLIATDVAGRGIDVQDVTLVINYELPDIKPTNNSTSLDFKKQHAQYNHVFQAYTHRIGRTGRGVGNKGTAVTLLGDRDKPLIPSFKVFLQRNGVKTFPRAFDEIADRGSENKIMY